ncbi:MAG: YciI family protein [Tannerella sp.]|jgi:uncharacterized protein YciI|nr:YciI family protein [Tannerella sp.]
MKAVVFYETSNVGMEKIMEVYPRHKQLVDDFSKEKKIIAIGTFANPVADGSMGIFTDKANAEEFIRQDPFVKEGIVAKATIKEWNEILLA